jgi:hypothetical protein
LEKQNCFFAKSEDEIQKTNECVELQNSRINRQQGVRQKEAVDDFVQNGCDEVRL